MNVLVTLTSAGTDTGPFDLFSNADNYIIPIDGGISRAALLAGYTCTTVPGSATIIRVKSLGTCTTYVDIAISFPTTTTTSTSTSTTTSTTTAAPTTTTTTTESPITTTTTTTAGGETTTTTTTSGGETTTTTTTSGGETTTTTTTSPGTTTTTTTVLAGCTEVNFVVMADGAYSYSYTLCGEGSVGPVSGTGTSGETLVSNICIDNGSFSGSNVQANPIGVCIPATTTTTTTAPTTTTTTTANVLCDQGNITIIASDGVYGAYSYTTCSGTEVSQPSGTGTQGQILETGVCVLSGTFSNIGGTVQLNPTGSCA